MAMILCAECDGQMSDTAAACPHCGAPHDVATRPIDKEIERRRIKAFREAANETIKKFWEEWDEKQERAKKHWW